ncbi:rubredoxin-like domain-containing protein [Peptostreptococcus porci]|uniref:rubredoxin-like domain-containing protein n=1 Tax=Peptostreptococcus porci TaxID=2652282 RepID=UPI002A833E84|nr:hypothetical protein [Peptostreptococcus porci]MDY4129345.1 hypothetical protein [Peptostreptococcus porci]
MKKFKCRECGYVHIGDQPPSICPVCAFDSNVFFELDDNKDSSSGYFEMLDTADSSTIKIIRNLFDAYSELAIISLAMSIQANHESRGEDVTDRLECLSRELSNQATIYAMFLGEFLEFNTELNIKDLKKKIAKLMSKNNELKNNIETEYPEYKKIIDKNNKKLENLIVKI